MADQDDIYQHPGLKNFNRPWELVKHVVTKALKWAAVGALVGGIAMALIPGLAGGLASLFTWGAGSGKIAAWAADKFIVGALWGGAVSGAVGAVSAVSTAEEAMDEAADRQMDIADRRESRQMRRDAMANAQLRQQMAMEQQAQALGLRANVPFMGQDQNGPGLG